VRKLTRLLALVALLHEWNIMADGTPKDRQSLRDDLLYYWHGIGWKLRHPVTALCSVDGVTRPWLAALRRLQLKLLGTSST
jgi:hypothetical protein